MEECGSVRRSVEACGGVWRSAEACDGLLRSAEECGGMRRSAEACGRVRRSMEEFDNSVSGTLVDGFGWPRVTDRVRLSHRKSAHQRLEGLEALHNELSQTCSATKGERRILQKVP